MIAQGFVLPALFLRHSANIAERDKDNTLDTPDKPKPTMHTVPGGLQNRSEQSTTTLTCSHPQSGQEDRAMQWAFMRRRKG
eukprot:COSAG06_NODE_561_length_14287_cov_13.422047_11_plen_81_part_00